MEPLTSEAARVLACLIEKQMTTPEYYPMTVNALVAACNQKTNRDPVMTMDEEAVNNALAELNELGLSRFTRSPGARTLKYLHKIDEALEIDADQAAIIAVMLLRGPQTSGELRSRTERYVSFRDVAAVEEVLRDLITRDRPLVEHLEREPGRKERRFRTFLSSFSGSGPSSAIPPDDRLLDRIASLEARIARLESELGVSVREEPI